MLNDHDQVSSLAERGEMTLASVRREVPTNRSRAGSAGALQLAADNALDQVVLDDGISVQAPTIPYLGFDKTVRVGDSVTDLVGVVDYGPVGTSAAGFKLQALSVASVIISRSNPRTAASVLPAGNVRVASANVLNFFTTLIDGYSVVSNTSGQKCSIGSPPTFSASNCRSADSVAEFMRQRDKIVKQLVALDADVPVGASMSDGDAVNNRAPLAQTFKAANGARFSVIVNHLKSKGGCPGGAGANADHGDGQGCWNGNRVRQAQRLASYFIPMVKAASSDDDVLLIGDLNAHGFEDPVNLLSGQANGSGLINLLEKYVRPGGIVYAYVFNGHSGCLDHALASAPRARQVAGATVWHNNADEPDAIDDNFDGKPQDLYVNNAYRASDHDPVVVSLRLAPASP